MLRRIVLSGAEASGKTVLARALSTALDTSWSAEYARQYAESVRRTLAVEDVAPIAAGQRMLEDAAMAAAHHGIVIHDTDLLSTLVYARHYYDVSPAWLEALVRTRVPSQTLLLSPDLPWVADGVRDRGESRMALDALFVATLAEFGRPWNRIGGDDRVGAALQAVSITSPISVLTGSQQ
jgi:NadR type nicotinamide-nucleotide adenylyltransferase